MTGFSADWLDFREPFDAAARAAGVGAIVRSALRPAGASDPRLQVIDLGAGTGANLRYAAPLLGGSQDWLMIDRDPLLLAAATGRITAWAKSRGAEAGSSDSQLLIHASGFECRVRRQSFDLATGVDRLQVPEKTLITASALLDLVSEGWLGTLADRAAGAAAAVWFALTYDGRMDCHPAEPEDAVVRELFNAHQLRDKGFGPALGPSAGQKAVRIFFDRGYSVCVESSDWRIGPSHQELQRILVDGWFTAAGEMDSGRLPQLQSWRERRRAHIAAGRSGLTVGHVDMAGVPAGSEMDFTARAVPAHNPG